MIFADVLGWDAAICGGSVLTFQVVWWDWQRPIAIRLSYTSEHSNDFIT